MNQKKNDTYVTQITKEQSQKLLNDLKSQGFEISKPLYTQFSAKKTGVVCTLYESGKLMVQGKEMKEFIEFYLEPELLKSLSYTYQDHEIDKTARIGIDEAGKGDFFGPLCIAGVYADEKNILDLKEMGVKDSKGMKDSTIVKLSKKIRDHFDHHIVRINPLKYNELYEKFKNLNHLLAWGHATTIESLASKTGCKNVLIDQFAAEHVVETALKRKNLDLALSQRHRGEEDLVVAAASILARSAFVEGIDKLSREFNMELPKGASNLTIQAGKKFVALYGLESLRHVAKLHFKTLDSIS